MWRYELDECVQAHVADDTINVNRVASWRTRVDADGHLESLFVDLHNSWQFDSSRWHGPADAPGRLLRALQRNERGRSATNRIAKNQFAGERLCELA